MGLDLYYNVGTTPCRAVLLTIKALNLSPNLIPVNVFEKEHLKPAFVKINPQHTLPTLVDDGFAIWESRAIMTYLVSKFGKGSNLYPEELKERAVIDQRLYFDIATLHARLGPYFYPTFAGGEPDKSKLPAIDEAFTFLDTFLEGIPFAAGQNLTVADLALVATVASFEAADYNVAQYPNVARWYQLVKSLVPGYEDVNRAGIASFKLLAKQLKAGEISHPRHPRK